MRLLIAQGPGFYGVNIRIIDEATYERLLAKYEWKPEDTIDNSNFDSVHTIVPASDPDRKFIDDPGGPTMLVMTQDIEPHEQFSVGFDSGWWEEGERAIEEALK